MDEDGPREVRRGKWDAIAVEVLNTLQLLTAKPVIYLVNLTKKAYLTKKSKWLGPVGQAVLDRKGGELVLPWSGKYEMELLDMEAAGEEAMAQFLKENPDGKSALPRIIKQGYHSLGLIHFFTCGKDEVRAWTIRNGRQAPQAAGVIHTDFEKGFIMAEVYHFSSIKQLGSESEVKANGKKRDEGKNYVVKDGDIMFFKFNT